MLNIGFSCFISLLFVHYHGNPWKEPTVIIPDLVSKEERFICHSNEQECYFQSDITFYYQPSVWHWKIYFNFNTNWSNV